MDKLYLKAFLKIAETGSISRASESLGIAQPSLSQQLLRLEDEVGAPLFRRTARGVTLTEAGLIFQRHARQLLHLTAVAIEEVRQARTEPTGEVVLAVPYSVSKLAGLTLVNAFLNHAPLVKFRLVEAFTGPIRGWLEARKIDLGIMNDLGPMRDLVSRPLASEELFVVGPAGRFDAQIGTISGAELAALPMILPGPQHGLRQVVEEQLRSMGIPINLRLEIDAMMHVPRLIAEGRGYSIAPLSAIAEPLAADIISIARMRDVTLRRTLCLVRNGGTVLTHASVRSEALTIKVLRRLIEKGVWHAELAPSIGGDDEAE